MCHLGPRAFEFRSEFATPVLDDCTDVLTPFPSITLPTLGELVAPALKRVERGSQLATSGLHGCTSGRGNSHAAHGYREHAFTAAARTVCSTSVPKGSRPPRGPGIYPVDSMPGLWGVRRVQVGGLSTLAWPSIFFYYT